MYIKLKKTNKNHSISVRQNQYRDIRRLPKLLNKSILLTSKKVNNTVSQHIAYGEMERAYKMLFLFLFAKISQLIPQHTQITRLNIQPGISYHKKLFCILFNWSSKCCNASSIYTMISSASVFKSSSESTQKYT